MLLETLGLLQDRKFPDWEGTTEEDEGDTDADSLLNCSRILYSPALEDPDEILEDDADPPDLTLAPPPPLLFCKKPIKL